jgi:transposase
MTDFKINRCVKSPQKKGRAKIVYKRDPAFHYIKEELARRIYIHHEKGEHFTIDDLHKYAKEECEYICGRTKLYTILKSMGYRYRKHNNRLVLIAQPHIILKRIKFIRKYLQYLQSDNYIFVFLDETWIYENGSQVRHWINLSDPKGIPKRVKGEGKGFTILHAGTSAGFLPGCDLLLGSEIEHRYYHKNMNSDIFTRWIRNQLLPALNLLDKPAVIVMDNAPYHSEQVTKHPVSSTKKGDMIQWLNENNIPYPPEATKKVLYNIICTKKQDIQKHYLIDDLVHTNGHHMLRLPPYNCQYNPIELAWGFLKNYYNKNISSCTESKTEKVKKMWLEAISHFTPEMWSNSVKHCEQLIKQDWQKLMGNASIEDIPPFIIQVAADSDSESDVEDDDENLEYE